MKYLYGLVTAPPGMTATPVVLESPFALEEKTFGLYIRRELYSGRLIDFSNDLNLANMLDNYEMYAVRMDDRLKVAADLSFQARPKSFYMKEYV